MEGAGSIMAMVGAFIGVAILLAIGIQILGNVQNSTPCSTLPGNAGTHQTVNNATGWALACLQNNTQTQSSYQLLGIALIVIAAVIILVIVKLL